ncbi:TrgA family protein [Pseudogemmobacter bohemicus]|uniref:TrgA family protein n=1 Tax=Pseudogemmobacter bohemicus TaxID=2250708 RepID=UPI000DD3F372|nr:TrgA family protein [Pseudogemmobacter bohemicus]
MPTSAKLVAAFWFGLMGWLAANAHLPALPDGGAGGAMMFRSISAVIGLLCGWKIMGNGVGSTYPDSIGSGLKTSIVMAFFALLVFSGRQMVSESMKMRYEGPMDAMLGWFTKMIENGRDMLTVGVLGVLIVAGVFGGPITEWAWRRWR